MTPVFALRHVAHIYTAIVISGVSVVHYVTFRDCIFLEFALSLSQGDCKGPEMSTSSSSHNLCTSDTSPLLSSPPQMPTSMEDMGKHERKRTPSVTWKRKRSLRKRKRRYGIHCWSSERRRENWKKRLRQPPVRMEREQVHCWIFSQLWPRLFFHQCAYGDLFEVLVFVFALTLHPDPLN